MYDSRSTFGTSTYMLIIVIREKVTSELRTGCVSEVYEGVQRRPELMVLALGRTAMRKGSRMWIGHLQSFNLRRAGLLPAT